MTRFSPFFPRHAPRFSEGEKDSATEKPKPGAEKEGAAEAAELFDLEGIPEPGQVGDDRRALPRAGADQASIPDDAGAGAPPDHLLKGPATEKRYRSLSGGPPKEALGPADSRPADTVFAIPEEDAEEVHRVEAPKSFAAFDRALSLVFAFGAFILVVCSYHGIGFSWDEGYYYVAARSTQAWLHLIHTDGLSAFSRENIDKYLGPGPDIPDQPSGNVPELPMVPKILYAVGLSIADAFHFEKPYIGMRLPIAVCYGLTVLGLYLLAGKYYARTGAVLTVLCYMAIPRVFGHAHIAATETIVCMLLVWMTYCFVKGLDSPWAAVLCGVCWGLALATKINAMFFPVPLLIWAHLFQRRRYANNVFALAFVAPFVMVAVWPWLWPEPFVRLVSYLKFFAGHKDISVFYFGQRYPLFDGTRVVRTPASYPFLMTVFTTPVLTLGLALLGLARTVANLRRHDIGVLYLLQALTPLFLAALPISPRYDGVRLFVPVFPFLALLAGVGGEGLAASLRGFRPFEQWPGAPRLFAQGLSVFIAAQGIVTISRCHPHELSHWNSLLGGFSGAYKARMETTYWGEAVNEDVYDYLQKLPDGTRVRPLALNDVCFRLLQEWDVIPRGLKIDTHPPSDVIVMQMREGFLGDEEQYLLSGILQIPCFALVQHDGIPFVVAFDLRGYPKAAAALMEFHDKIEAMRQAAEKAVRSAASASGGVQ